MSDLFPDAEIPLEAQIACVEREIAMRQKVYARRVDMRRMTPRQAEQEIAAMTAVLKTLERLRDGCKS